MRSKSLMNILKKNENTAILNVDAIYAVIGDGAPS